MATVLSFKEFIDKPEWRPLSNAPATTSAGQAICSDLRTGDNRVPLIFHLQSATVFNIYNPAADEWLSIGSPALSGTFGAGAGCVFVPTGGPSGSCQNGSSTTVVGITAATWTPGLNQLANRGDGKGGYRIRFMSNGSGHSGVTEERTIIANTAGSNPFVTLDSALSFTPNVSDRFELLSGAVAIFSAGTVANTFKYYGLAENAFSAGKSTTNLPASITTDFAAVVLDEQYVPEGRVPGEGFFGNLVSTGVAATTITGTVAGADSAVLTNEYRNFQIRIVTDATNPTAVGQRRKITSHTAGASPVYTVATWTVTPSSGATFVIEGNNDLLLLSSATTTVYSYAAGGFAADATWSTAGVSGGATQYANQASAMAAGTILCWPFGRTIDTGKIARHSHVFKFGAQIVGAYLDIAGGANGVWTNITAVGNSPLAVALTAAGTCAVYDPSPLNHGKYLYLNATTFNIQRFWRVDLLNWCVEPWCTLRYSQGAAVAGGKMALSLFKDGSVYVPVIYALRHTGTEFFDCLIST